MLGSSILIHDVTAPGNPGRFHLRMLLYSCVRERRVGLGDAGVFHSFEGGVFALEKEVLRLSESVCALSDGPYIVKLWR